LSVATVVLFSFTRLRSNSLRKFCRRCFVYTSLGDELAPVTHNFRQSFFAIAVD